MMRLLSSGILAIPWMSPAILAKLHLSAARFDLFLGAFGDLAGDDDELLFKFALAENLEPVAGSS